MRIRKKARHYFLLILRVGLGLTFIYAGTLKIQDTVAFAGSVAAYKLFPYFFNYLVAATIPWVELTCGILLVVGYKVRATAGLLAAMNILFIVLLASTIVRGLDIDCGCFRQGGEKTPAWIAIMRDILILAVALILFTEQKERKFFS
jgi:putative oxidoreductase